MSNQCVLMPLAFRLLHFLRFFPRFPGKQRFAHRLMRLFRDQTGCVINGENGVAFQVPSLKEPIAFELLIHGVYERDTSHLLRRLLKPGDVLVDVGANIGAISIPAAHHVGPTGRVIAIEASLPIFEYLKSNVRRNKLSQIETVHSLLSEHDSDNQTFFNAPLDRFGMGGRCGYPGFIPERMRARSLDGILDEYNVSRVNVIKIDVEGFELDILRGAVKPCCLHQKLSLYLSSMTGRKPTPVFQAEPLRIISSQSNSISGNLAMYCLVDHHVRRPLRLVPR